MRHTLAAALLITLTLGASVATADDTRLAAGEILVETSDVSGSDIPRITVTAVVDAPPSRVWAVVSDCANYSKTMPRIEESRLIRREGSTFVCETVVGLPFPLSDLRSTTTATHTEGPNEWRRQWSMIEGNYRFNNGYWSLKPYGDNGERTLAVYSVHAAPEGSVPDWMRRRAQESSMPGVLEAVRKAVK
ncbi:hypothetical protein DL240_17385 [Lujinxingia litoralis]|uniref:Coenzyme Q-binding protein COQ10 START domain-containing protein n=1 Tax=Lujinxingia litoralis TaxID=2211119 RepID=A0A328C367_9DELT|nr:SRPBCC family protein [Lujinxingia litoralis]RAL20355.1 hypothetical protein DL240_17385 [Lujinxingia litoralis]